MSTLTRWPARIGSFLYAALRGVSTNIQHLGERAVTQALNGYAYSRGLLTPSSDVLADLTRQLRSPVARLAEVYVAYVWPGTVQDALVPVWLAEDAEKLSDALDKALAQVWKVSRFEAIKSWMIRSYSISGDMFIKVVADNSDPNAVKGATPNRLYFQVLDPETVTELTEDLRGELTGLRIDVETPKTDTESAFIHTEIWSMEGVKRWDRRTGNVGDKASTLPNPDKTLTLAELGTNGVLPIAHAKFRDIGAPLHRGACAFWAAIPGIDEASLMATSMHALAFRHGKPTWGIVGGNATDSAGRVLAPASLPTNSEDEVDLSGETVISVPGDLKCLVPSLPYSQILAMVDAQVAENIKNLPELGMETAIQTSNIATATLRMMYAPAIARILEARKNAEAALAQADLVALTMGQELGLDGFNKSDIGTEFEHTFEARDVLPLTETERIEQAAEKAKIMIDKIEVGLPLARVLQEEGYSDADIDEIQTQIANAKRQGVTLEGQLLKEARSRQAQEGVPTAP